MDSSSLNNLNLELSSQLAANGPGKILLYFIIAVALFVIGRILTVAGRKKGAHSDLVHPQEIQGGILSLIAVIMFIHFLIPGSFQQKAGFLAFIFIAIGLAAIWQDRAKNK